MSDNINSILYHDGNLWLGTDNGLCRFNIADKSVASFDFPETAGKIDYTSDASVKLSNGTSAWGTSEGLIILDTESMASRTPSGRIYLQDILLSSRSMRDMPDIMPEMPLDEITDLTLQHDQNNITFSLQPLGSLARTHRSSRGRWRDLMMTGANFPTSASSITPTSTPATTHYI